jgi:hypothetical protein
MFPKVQKIVKERTFTLPSALMLGVGVRVDLQIFRGRLQESKPNGLKSFLYHWKSIET